MDLHGHPPAEYRTVTGVAGPLVVLDKVKASCSTNRTDVDILTSHANYSSRARRKPSMQRS